MSLENGEEKMNNCGFSGKVQDFLDGELSEPEKLTVSSHARECAVCNAIIDNEKEQRELLASLSTATLAPERYEISWDKIESKVYRQSSFSPVYKLMLGTSFALLTLFGIGIGFIAKFGFDIKNIKANQPAYSDSYGMSDGTGRAVPATMSDNSSNYSPEAMERAIGNSKQNYGQGHMIIIPKESHQKLMNLEKSYNELLERYNTINTQNQVNWEILNMMIQKSQNLQPLPAEHKKSKTDNKEKKGEKDESKK
ncbi:MAG: zf-HC2 domain-containing protein [Planctomycetes bacterium]|nr:zf-HC2 domain-containing protein [Planctomycetota bacterium]